MHYVTPELELTVGDIGIFTMNVSSRNLQSNKTIFETATDPNGFIKYNLSLTEAHSVHDHYNSIQQNLYTPIQQMIGQSYTNKKRLEKHVPTKAVSGSGSISSISPLVLSGGTKSELTINGSGFGASQGGSYVTFKNANDGGASIVAPDAVEYVS